jgi:hypothetical protein
MDIVHALHQHFLYGTFPRHLKLLFSLAFIKGAHELDSLGDRILVHNTIVTLNVIRILSKFTKAPFQICNA